VLCRAAGAQAAADEASAARAELQAQLAAALAAAPEQQEEVMARLEEADVLQVGGWRCVSREGRASGGWALVRLVHGQAAAIRPAHPHARSHPPPSPPATNAHTQAELSAAQAALSKADEDRCQLLEQMTLLKFETERSRRQASEAQQVAALRSADSDLTR
jgi:hypothetical protein